MRAAPKWHILVRVWRRSTLVADTISGYLAAVKALRELLKERLAGFEIETHLTDSQTCVQTDNQECKIMTDRSVGLGMYLTKTEVSITAVEKIKVVCCLDCADLIELREESLRVVRQANLPLCLTSTHNGRRCAVVLYQK